jgi:hypothetical protein
MQEEETKPGDATPEVQLAGPETTEAEGGTEQDTQEAAYAERIKALEERERQIEIKERHNEAVEQLRKRGLPESLVDLLDLNSADTLKASIELAARARNAPTAPKAGEFTGGEAPGKKASYAEFEAWFNSRK